MDETYSGPSQLALVTLERWSGPVLDEPEEAPAWREEVERWAEAPIILPEEGAGLGPVDWVWVVAAGIQWLLAVGWFAAWVNWVPRDPSALTTAVLFAVVGAWCLDQARAG